jgi:hypothetical protein
MKLKIQLWRNPVENNWSVQVNDKRADFVTLERVKQLVAKGLSAAKKSLLEQESNRIN